MFKEINIKDVQLIMLNKIKINALDLIINIYFN